MSTDSQTITPEQVNIEDGESSLESSFISNDAQLDKEEGIIEVVKQNDKEEEEDEELRLLRSLQKFEPFIKESDKSFSLESLLSIKSNASKPTMSSQITKDRKALSDPMQDMFFGLQSYIEEKMTHINMEQRLLFKRVAYVNELSTTCNTIMSKAHTQAKLAAEKMTEINVLKQVALKTQENAIQLFKSLSHLEQYLDPADKITITDSRWPILSELRAQGQKSIEHPSIERYISSSSEITTVGTSTSPLLEKFILTGEPVKEDPPPQNTPSLALNKLRGLSSRSNIFSPNNK